MLKIKITSKSNTLGFVTPDCFRKNAGAPKTMFLAEVVEKWNQWKTKIGEPERAEIVIA